MRSLRNARAEYAVDVGRRVPATVVAASSELRALLQGEAAVLVALCKLDPERLSFVASAADIPRAAGEAAEEAITLVVRDGLEVVLPLAGLADPVKELARLVRPGGRVQTVIDALCHQLIAPIANFTPTRHLRPDPKHPQAKQAAKLQKDLAGCTSRLDSPKFVAGAPPDIVAGLQKQAAELRQQLEQVLLLLEGPSSLSLP